MRSYEDFVAAKRSSLHFEGIENPDLRDCLFPFQGDLVRWALRRGRAAVFAGTGLGKSLMELSWSSEVSKRGRVLGLAPLAVAEQLVQEGEKFGIPAVYARRGSDCSAPITVTNYELLSHFDPDDFVGVFIDESSIMKDFTGALRNQIIETFARTPFRLAGTATPAPNDDTELGNHAEFLGIKTRTEMLSEYFVHDGGTTSEWRLKRHAEREFWRWVCSWAAMVSKPSDLGYDNGAYDLPPLIMHEERVEARHEDYAAAGYLFAPVAITLSEQRSIRRSTRDRRIAKCQEILARFPGEPAVIWCELNQEQDETAAALGKYAISITGSMKPEVKVSLHQDWLNEKAPCLITKGEIFGRGMNWQHCALQIFLGSSHSFEKIFHSIRRSWRFGQRRPVDIFMILAENEEAIVSNYRRKELSFARMTEAMIEHTQEFVRGNVLSARHEYLNYEPQIDLTIPEWLTTGDL